MIGATPTAWCRRDLKGGAMFLFEAGKRPPKGKNREPGLQAFPIQSFFTQISSNFGCIFIHS